MDYRREIDGLRALAVLPVVFFHAGFQAFSGGFVGVDIFFVISGYLITSIILAELKAGTFSIANFYERRARRILPALFVVLLACLAAAWLCLMPADLKRFAQSLIAVSAFASNLLFWNTQGYFAPAAELEPLMHTWSLAVEEQYYLLFPVFMMLAWRAGRKPVLLMLAALAVASLALGQWAVMHQPVAAFYLLPMRGWELLIGAFAALHLHDTPRPAPNARVAQAGALLGAGLIVWSICAFDQQTPFPGLYALVPTVGAVLIIVFATPATVVGALLGKRLPVAIGLISYSTYLWHQPLLAFAKHRYLNELTTPAAWGLIAASVALGYLTWRFVETPFRNKRAFRRQQIFLYSVVGSVFFAVIGTVWTVQEGYGGYYFDTLSAEQKSRSQLIAAHTNYDMYEFMVDDGACQFWGRTMTPAMVQRFDACAKRHGKAVIVFGDSHAMNLYNVMAKARVYPFVVGVSQGYCRIDTNKDYCQFGQFERFLREHARDVKTLVYHQTGSPLLHPAGGYAQAPNKFDGQAALQIDNGQVLQIISYLNRQEPGLRVVWVGPWAEAQVASDANMLRRATMNPRSLAAFRQLDQAILAAFHTRGPQQRVEYVSALDVLAVTAQSLWIDDCLLFKDLNHLSRCGEDHIAAASHAAFWAAIIGPP
jgi:peptidoglycan/LPS O-acetylase OafA/YrhL